MQVRPEKEHGCQPDKIREGIGYPGRQGKKNVRDIGQDNSKHKHERAQHIQRPETSLHQLHAFNDPHLQPQSSSLPIYFLSYPYRNQCLTSMKLPIYQFFHSLPPAPLLPFFLILFRLNSTAHHYDPLRTTIIPLTTSLLHTLA